jgi:hypothetical protein
MRMQSLKQCRPSCLISDFNRLQDGRQTRALHAHAWHHVMGVFKNAPNIAVFGTAKT